MPVPMPGSGFPMPYVMVFYMSNDWRGGVVVCFVDIDRIVENHCLNFLFMILYSKNIIIQI
jgi:hypothetical protein